MVVVECVFDSREQQLFADVKNFFPEEDQSIKISIEMLTIGDLLIKTEDQTPLLLIERKSVRDLVQSLKDGRYHDQRRRWLMFQTDFPNSRISLWVEGDIISTDMDPVIKSSLINSLFRLQSKYNIIVHQMKSRDSFVKSLYYILEKFVKDPNHLLNNPTQNENELNMKQYKKTTSTEETFWTCCLANVPGISYPTATKIVGVFPSLCEFIDEARNNHDQTFTKLSQIAISTSRKLGRKQAEKIIRHIIPLDKEEKF